MIRSVSQTLPSKPLTLLCVTLWASVPTSSILIPPGGETTTSAVTRAERRLARMSSEMLALYVIKGT